MLNDADASGFKKYIWRWGLPTSAVGLMDWQVLSDFNSTWILMNKTHCFCFVEEGVIA